MTIAYQGKLDAKRKKGRPPTSLLSNITNVSNLKIHEIARASKDRLLEELCHDKYCVQL